jgi:hypothetical protein
MVTPVNRERRRSRSGLDARLALVRQSQLDASIDGLHVDRIARLER